MWILCIKGNSSMQGIDASLPADWYAQGNLDIRTTEILLTQDGLLPIAAFHLQQAVEKYLKGFLLFKGRSPRRIHDLEILIQEVISLDEDFSSFLPACQRITEYYIETRYPIGIQTSFGREILDNDLATVHSLIELIYRKILQ